MPDQKCPSWDDSATTVLVAGPFKFWDAADRQLGQVLPGRREEF
jgi:hypothetical protein